MTALKLLACIGDIDQSFIEEATFADVLKTTRKRAAKYGAIAAAASIGIAATYWLVRQRKSA